MHRVVVVPGSAIDTGTIVGKAGGHKKLEPAISQENPFHHSTVTPGQLKNYITHFHFYSISCIPSETNKHRADLLFTGSTYIRASRSFHLLFSLFFFFLYFSA